MRQIHPSALDWRHESQKRKQKLAEEFKRLEFRFYMKNHPETYIETTDMQEFREQYRRHLSGQLTEEEYLRYCQVMDHI